MVPSAVTRRCLSAAILVMLTAAPFLYFRWCYTYGKRLREVEAGKVYRSGQMTADGFAEAIARYQIKTIVNLQDDYPDPDIDANYLGTSHLRESDLCRRLGVRYVFIAPDLVSRRQDVEPAAIDQFLRVMDDPTAYPVLLHCRAGLHRTGIMTAVYRMEYQGWGWREAWRDLKANGFGEFACTSANDYVLDYLIRYRPRQPEDRPSGARTAAALPEP